MKLLRWKCRRSGPQPAKSTPDMTTLPLELLQLIAALLPVHSAVALALCTRRFYLALGKQYCAALGTWRAAGGMTYKEITQGSLWIEPRRGPLYEFLALLERDMPNYILCNRCIKLHPPASKQLSYSQTYYLDADARPCLWYSQWDAYKALPSSLQYSMLHWTMERYRRGLDVRKQLLYFYEESYKHGTEYAVRYAVKEARIRGGNFLVRAQDWLLIKETDEPEAEMLAALRLMLCYHYYVWERPGGKFERLVRCRVAHRNESIDCKTCGGLRRCAHCHTEFQLDTVVLGRAARAIVVTRWLDLGEGLSDSDPKWTNRFDPGKGHQPIKPGRIRSEFEGVLGDSFVPSLDPLHKRLFLEQPESMTWGLRRGKFR
ncbi:MAG: hypothetical protein M1818_005750 [Claussenomyces sp. TS43310]|nr:MAG: hypothetical protein M1818_005750 [Claussenomyces sp. TS43310]